MSLRMDSFDRFCSNQHFFMTLKRTEVLNLTICPFERLLQNFKFSNTQAIIAVETLFPFLPCAAQGAESVDNQSDQQTLSRQSVSQSVIQQVNQFIVTLVSMVSHSEHFLLGRGRYLVCQFSTISVVLCIVFLLFLLLLITVNYCGSTLQK